VYWNCATEPEHAAEGRLRRAIIAVLLLWLIGLGGCAADGGPAAGFGGGAIDSLSVLSFPVAVNLDGVPGTDGFAIKVYAGNLRTAKTREITRGSLEVLLYDGVKGSDSAPPLRTWTFTAEQLRQYRIHATIGVGYQLALRWGENRPTQPRFSIVTRLAREGLPDVVSAPIDIEMAR